MQKSRSNPCLMIHHNQNRNTACVEHVGSVLAKERLTRTRQNRLIQSHAADASDVAIRRPAPIALIPRASTVGTRRHAWVNATGKRAARVRERPEINEAWWRHFLSQSPLMDDALTSPLPLAPLPARPPSTPCPSPPAPKRVPHPAYISTSKWRL